MTSMDLHHELQRISCNLYVSTYPYMFPFGLSSVISKVFVADFEHVFVCWKRYRTKTIVVLMIKYLTQRTSTYSKSAVETLKVDVKSAKSQQYRLRSLLTICNMFTAFFKFSGVLQTCPCLLLCFCFHSVSGVFIFSLKQISHLDLFFSIFY